MQAYQGTERNLYAQKPFGCPMCRDIVPRRAAITTSRSERDLGNLLEVDVDVFRAFIELPFSSQFVKVARQGSAVTVGSVDAEPAPVTILCHPEIAIVTHCDAFDQISQVIAIGLVLRCS